MSALVLRRVSWEHPDLPASLFAATAWLALLTIATGAPAAQGAHDWSHQTMPWLATSVGWFLMCVAMMVPAALPHVRRLALSSRWERRQRTIVLFVGSYLAVWMAFGATALAALLGFKRLLPMSAETLLLLALATAAVWTSAPWKWRALRACHIVRPLPPHGRKADRACLAQGLRYGALCLVVTWPLMLAMAIAGHDALPLMTLLLLIVVSERIMVQPSRLKPLLVGILAAAAVSIYLIG